MSPSEWQLDVRFRSEWLVDPTSERECVPELLEYGVKSIILNAVE